MAYKIKLDNKFYSIRDGFIHKPSANDKLDSGTIIFTTNEQLNIEPFDRVEFYNDDKLMFMQVVDNFIENIVSFSDPKKYEYTINLMSQTKVLERITLPSLSITSRVGTEQKTIYFYIKQYVDKYLPKVKVLFFLPPTDDELVKYDQVPMFEIDEKVRIRFSNITCPEFSWNEPTLREVLDDLFKVDDCLCVVKNNVITFMDLKQRGKDIDKSKIVDTQRTMSAQDYVSDLNITMKNSIGKNLVNTCEYVSPRSESGETTTNNAVIQTQHPIYNLKSVIVSYVGEYIRPAGGNSKYAYIVLDITKNIKEKDEYNILKPNDIEPTDETYQKNNLYYKRGENKIEGLGEVRPWVAIIWNVISQVAKENVDVINRFGSDYQLTTGGNLDMRDLVFKIEYETLAERKMKVGKYLPIKNSVSEIFDNQTNSYVNVQQQSMFEYFKANRLGNEIKIIKAVYKNPNEVPQVFDRLGNEILFESEVSYYDDYIAFQGYLTSNYILDNYFTGVKSKRRSWAIAQGKDALTRYDVVKYYCQFSFKPKFEFIEELERIAEGEIIDYFVSPLIVYTASPIKHCLVNTFSGVKAFPKSPLNSYEIDSNVEVQGMSLCFNFGFNDNYQVGTYIFKDDKLYRNGIYPYCNNDGNFDSIRITLLDYVDPTGGKFTLPNDLEEINGTDNALAMRNNIAKMAYNKPLIENVDYNYAQLVITKDLYKDNREIIAQTIQFEFCSDTKDIIVRKPFIEWQKAISTNDNDLGFIYVSQNETYDLDSKYALGDINYDDFKVEIIPIANKPLEVNCVKIKFSRKNGQPLNIKSFGLTSPFADFMLGVNIPSDIDPLSSYVEFYMSILTSRDENVYDNNKDYNYQGKMWNVDYKIKVQ